MSCRVSLLLDSATIAQAPVVRGRRTGLGCSNDLELTLPRKDFVFAGRHDLDFEVNSDGALVLHNLSRTNASFFNEAHVKDSVRVPIGEHVLEVGEKRLILRVEPANESDPSPI